MKHCTTSVSFYFLRHGETDWNKNRATPYCPDDMPLNETGIEQAYAVTPAVERLGIVHLYTSPLARAQQTAAIVNKQLQLPVDIHHAFSLQESDILSYALEELLAPGKEILIVSHGEVYRSLVDLLAATTDIPKAKNCGLYQFVLSADGWIVIPVLFP